MKKFAGSLKLYLAQYREVAAFAQFGSDLDASTRFLLSRGARLTELLSTFRVLSYILAFKYSSFFSEQGQYQPLSTEVQVPIIYAGVNGLVSYKLLYLVVIDFLTIVQLDAIPVDQITKWEAEFREHLTTQTALLQEISTGVVTPELEGKIKKVVEEHVASFVSS